MSTLKETFPDQFQNAKELDRKFEQAQRDSNVGSITPVNTGDTTSVNPGERNENRKGHTGRAVG